MPRRRSLSVGTVMVLHALARGHRYGFDILEQTGLTSGTVYPALDRLADDGLAESAWEDAEVAHAEKRPPRRYFEITAKGKEALIEALDRYRALAPLTIDGVRYPGAADRAKSPRRPRLVALLLSVGALVVPGHRRAAWRRQWEAEVEHRVGTPGGRRGLARFAWGAVLHALHLRRRERTMTGWTRELAQVARGLLRRPGFSLVAVATLAVGIGAASAVFSLAEAMLLRPLPLPESHELVRVHSTNPEQGHGWFSVSVPDFDGIQATGAFERRSLYRVEDRDLAGGGDPLRVRVASVHDGFYETLGTAPVVGRLLGPDDQRADADPVAVMAEGLWISRYGADPGIAGATIRLDGRAYTVVGVAPDRGAWPAGADVWTPLAWGGSAPEWADVRSNHAFQVVARLADGVDADEASERVRSWSRTVYADADIDPRDAGTELLAVPLHRSEGGQDAGALFGTLGAAVAMVLLLACMNASGLLLGRGMARARELSVRAALGAGRLRITGLLLGEALVLALVGGALGVVLGVVGIGRAWESTPPAIRSLGDIHLNPTVLLGALGISVVAALVAGLVPALKATRIPSPRP